MVRHEPTAVPRRGHRSSGRRSRASRHGERAGARRGAVPDTPRTRHHVLVRGTDGEDTEDEFIRGGKTFVHAWLPGDAEFFLFTYTYGLGAYDDVVLVLSPEKEPRCLTCVDGTTYDEAVGERMVDRLRGLSDRDLYRQPRYEATRPGVVDALRFSRRRLCRYASSLDPFYTFERPGATWAGSGGRGR